MKTLRKKNKEKDDFKIPKSVQDTIPVNKVYKDGIVYCKDYNGNLHEVTMAYCKDTGGTERKLRYIPVRDNNGVEHIIDMYTTSYE